MSIFKSIISPMQNCDEIAVRFCKQLQVRMTETTVKKEITEHPDYPSLLSISDALRSCKVENLSVKTTVDNFESFPTPFIAQVNGQTLHYSLFAIINNVFPNGTINWYNPEKKRNEVISKLDFKKTFTGYVMLAEAEVTSEESDYIQKKKEETLRNFWNGTIALALPVILLVLSGYTILTKGFQSSIFPISYAIVTLIGTITGALLLLYEVDQFNPTLQKVCHGGTRTNCGAILNSKASHIWGISWSIIGFTYFCGLLVAIMVVGLINSYMLSMIALINLLALPYIFFSIYYQAKVARQWCPMCLTVQTCLLIQFIIALSGHFYSIPTTESVLSLFIVAVSLVIVFISVQLLIPALRKSTEGKHIQLELARLKHNPEIFHALLQKQKKISESTEGLGIRLGNPNGKIKLIKVCNPYCGPCASAHPIIDELLENNPDLQVQIIFTATGDVNDLTTPPVQHLLAISENEDNLFIKKALDDWYLMKKRNYAQFAEKYPLNDNFRLQIDKIKAMHSWTEKEDITFTPTFFINTYQLPEIYQASDLKYFLSV